MAQPVEIYVDPSIAMDNGAGTLLDPYGDLEWAIEQVTFNTTNGTRVNIKSGTDELIAAVLEDALNNTGTSIAWAPAEVAPCIFQGYTSAAGDGGIGGISGGGSIGIMGGATFDYISFIDLHLHNCGAAVIIDLDNQCSVIRCEFDNTTGSGVLLDNGGLLLENYAHNVGGTFALQVVTGLIAFNFIYSDGDDPQVSVDVGANSVGYRNIIKISGTSDGIRMADGSSAINNSIWSNAGTGQGIIGIGSVILGTIFNNLIEGFSGSGGVGIDVSATAAGIRYYGNNAAFDNATNFAAPTDFVVYELGGSSSNESLTVSPFKNVTSAAGDKDFSPVNTGSVKEGSLPDNFGKGQ